MTILSYVTDKVAKAKMLIWAPQAKAQMVPVVQDVIRQSYLRAGALDLYDPSGMVPFLTDSWKIYTSHIVGWIEREKPGAVCVFGAISVPSIPILATADKVGAISLAGTARPGHSYDLLVADHYMLGDEIYAAGAYLSQESAQICNIVAADIARVLVASVFLLSLLLYWSGFPVIDWLKI
jgi:hypothetical protein